MSPEIWVALISALVGGGLVKLIERLIPSTESRSETQKNIRDELWGEIYKLREHVQRLQETINSRESQFVQVREAMIKEANSRVDLVRQTFYELQEQYYRTKSELTMAKMEVSLIRENVKNVLADGDCRDLITLFNHIDQAKEEAGN